MHNNYKVVDFETIKNDLVFMRSESVAWIIMAWIILTSKGLYIFINIIFKNKIILNSQGDAKK